jgi:hypothetical protein
LERVFCNIRTEGSSNLWYSQSNFCTIFLRAGFLLLKFEACVQPFFSLWFESLESPRDKDWETWVSAWPMLTLERVHMLVLVSLSP